jgi:hypothetical protein
VNSKQFSNSRDRQYLLILFVVIGLTAVSNAMKELREFREITSSAGSLIAAWSCALTPTTARTPTVVKTYFAGRGIQNRDEFGWRGVVAQGSAVEIKGLNGCITAKPADANEVQVTATKKSRRSDVDSVQIKVVPHAGGVTSVRFKPIP